MGLIFNRGSDDGCSGHHWGEYHQEWCSAYIESASATGSITIVVPRVAQCQHNGCYKTKKSGSNERYTVSKQLLHLVRMAGTRTTGSEPNKELADELTGIAQRVDPSITVGRVGAEEDHE